MPGFWDAFSREVGPAQQRGATAATALINRKRQRENQLQDQQMQRLNQAYNNAKTGAEVRALGSQLGLPQEAIEARAGQIDQSVYDAQQPANVQRATAEILTGGIRPGGEVDSRLFDASDPVSARNRAAAEARFGTQPGPGSDALMYNRYDRNTLLQAGIGADATIQQQDRDAAAEQRRVAEEQRAIGRDTRSQASHQRLMESYNRQEVQDKLAIAGKGGPRRLADALREVDPDFSDDDYNRMIESADMEDAVKKLQVENVEMEHKRLKQYEKRGLTQGEANGVATSLRQGRARVEGIKALRAEHMEKGPGWLAGDEARIAYDEKTGLYDRDLKEQNDLNNAYSASLSRFYGTDTPAGGGGDGPVDDFIERSNNGVIASRAQAFPGYEDINVMPEARDASLYEAPVYFAGLQGNSPGELLSRFFGAQADRADQQQDMQAIANWRMAQGEGRSPARPRQSYTQGSLAAQQAADSRREMDQLQQLQTSPSGGTPPSPVGDLNLPQRNKNPGNLKFGGIGDKFAARNPDGTPKTDRQGHLIFESPENGFLALREDLLAKVEGRSQHGTFDTLADLGAVYAEDPKWAEGVGKILNVSPNTSLQEIDMDELSQAVARQEGYQ